jgi:hypothetical protein
MGWEEIQNTGKALIEILKDNAPTSDIASATCNAVPKVEDWQNLGGGSPQAAKGRTICCMSPLGFTNVKCDIVINYQYGATYKGGGAFIPACWISLPAGAEVALMYHVEAKMNVISLGNVGSGNRPIAQLTVQLVSRWWNLTNSYPETRNYDLFGDGRPPRVY